MGSLLQLWNEWEIKVLVLISFTLQVFLFFTGVLRPRSANSFLRFSTWIGYLGADWVAVYILGFLSRQVRAPTEDGQGTSDPLLTFIWAPFLLVHLGGQDTITAFATVDSNLWLRHCLNLVLQATLALYVFWKSTLRQNVLLLVTGIFVFVAGIIKYGERIMALKYGTLQSLNRSNSDDDKLLEQKFGREEYSDVVGTALTAMPAVRRLFAGETFYRMEGKYTDRLLELEIPSSGEVSFKVLEIELQMIYDDLYTKATVLRTRSGIIFRCISQVSVIVALVLFLVSNKQRYSKADVWITYVLFLGGFCMEVCGAFMIIAVSPWTWLWFKTRQWRWLTGVSWHILCQIGMPENRKLWSNQMGQYTAASYLGHYSGSSSSWKQWMMKRIIRTVNFLGVGKGTLFWFSKVLDTNYVKVDRKIMEAICQGVDHFHPYTNYSPRKQNFQNLAQLLELIESPSRTDLGYAILLLHAFTEVHLYKYSVLPTAPAEATGNIEIEDTLHIMVEICRKLSNYMLYLLATNQEMLSVSGSTKQFFEGFREINIDGNDDNAKVNKFDQELRELGLTHQPQLCKETLEELRDIWIRLLIYAAGKSRPQMHAGQIARGGELLTFAWLIMLHCSVGDSGMRRIELSSTGVFGRQRDVAYVFNVEQSSARSV